MKDTIALAPLILADMVYALYFNATVHTMISIESIDMSVIITMLSSMICMNPSSPTVFILAMSRCVAGISPARATRMNGACDRAIVPAISISRTADLETMRAVM